MAHTAGLSAVCTGYKRVDTFQGAVVAMTRALAIDEAEHGVRVNWLVLSLVIQRHTHSLFRPLPLSVLISSSHPQQMKTCSCVVFLGYIVVVVNTHIATAFTRSRKA